ncbi:hypothetical protein DNX69_03425 [Rhodopseudomonas palustris]|uniref:Uncharacterized protein n=2 Tax=Rhodopseudomonas palustris TaxID=1076 RepID=A0A323UMD2_RHOPL|nr:hypothetical protein DNX69_03425 [Rhodopseudomonas palustris]
MTHHQPGRRSIVSRALAAMILTSIYCFSMIGVTALVSGATSTAANAQRGDGRGRGRGDMRGRGRGRGEMRGRGRGSGRGRGHRDCFINAGGFRVCY